MAEDESLPLVPQDLSLVLKPPKDLEETATPEEAARADLPLANSVLQAIYLGWGNVTSIAAMCKLVDATIKATKHRRDVLRLPYGAKSEDSGSRQVAYPID